MGTIASLLAAKVQVLTRDPTELLSMSLYYQDTTSPEEKVKIILAQLLLARALSDFS
jgi:hypothetical protein